jgi:hypothetical protein
MIDDLLDARDDLEHLLDAALPALEARPLAEGAEMLAVLLVAPLRRGGPSEPLRRLVVRRLAARGTPEAIAVLAAIAALGDGDTAARARKALDAAATAPAIAGIGGMAFEQGWRIDPGATGEGLAARMRRPGEPGARLMKLWLEPGEMLAGGWTDPLDDRRLERERIRFARAAGGSGEEPALDAAATVAEVDRIVRRAADLGLPLAEGVALVIAQLRHAAGGPEWPPFAVLATPE